LSAGTARLLAVSLCAAGLALPAAADAAVFPITTTADMGDATPDGACNSGPAGTCPLREAVQESNSGLNPGDDTVELPPGNYSFATGAQSLTEAAGNGKLTILGGTARDTTIDGADQATIFTVATGGSLELRELTLHDGKSDIPGGGIRNDGTLTLVDAALTSNEAIGGGGAIGSTGTLTLDRVTLSGNKTTSRGGAVSVVRTGGANPGIATITNSTVGANYSRGGGALMLAGGGTLTLLNSTVSGNAAGIAYGAGGLEVEDTPSSIVLANSIVAGNTDRDCEADKGGVFVSQGGNVTGDDSCDIGPPADPKLGPLQDNGGQTDTFALFAGSAAVDAATAPGCPGVDQRGAARPVGAACDAGAFEGEVEPPQPPDPPTPSAPSTPSTPAAPAAVDATPPGISDAFATNPVFAVNLRGAAAGRRRVPSGTTFRFTLSEAARVSLRIERSSPGRRVAGKCRRPTRSNRRAPSCRRWVGVRTFHRDSVAGSNRIRFSGRVLVGGRARALRPGRYRLRLGAVDGAGNSSTPVTIRFRVVRVARAAG
jgi:hypothetical protein